MAYKRRHIRPDGSSEGKSALQQLAMCLKKEGDLSKANSYLKIALDDAVFYNNRLRMLEIAEKIHRYCQCVSEDNRR